MADQVNGFFAYPAAPDGVGQMIEAAAARLKERSYAGQIITWRDIDNPGRFIADGILEKIDAANLVLADISALNFNVTYEIGYAIGAGKRVVVVKQAHLKDVNSKIASLGIFDTLGYQEYGTAQELE